MSTLRCQCPHCGALFLADLNAATNALHCPACRFDLLRNGDNSWYIVRHRQKLGPYAWPQLKARSAKEPFLAGDILMCREAVKDIPTATPVKLGSHAASAGTICDGLAETLIPWSSAGRCDHAMPAMENTLRFGDFQLLRKLGSGGMGAVYLALQKSKSRRVALKLPSPAITHVPDQVHRFLREAQVLSALRHPGIVEFLGSGEEKGVPFFAMEFIEGFSTAQLMKFRNAPLAVGDALHIVHKCVAALRYSHEKNIIHRDIKPQNIMITAMGKVKIMDLGLAKPMQEDLSLTETGLTVGTPRFMAPEQARDAKHVDVRTDIYALGGVLYFFLTGRAPFEESTALNLLLAKERGLFPSPRRFNPDVPPRLCLLIDRMLARDPRARFQSCEELINALDCLELVSAFLSFNPLHVLAETSDSEPPPAGVLEVLLVNDNAEDVELAQKTLAEKQIANNMTTLPSALEAMAFLNKQGRFAHAPTPDLIILGGDLEAVGIVELLQEIREKPSLLKIPFIVLANSDAAHAILAHNDLAVTLFIRQPGDLARFEDLLQSFQGMCLTLVEPPR